LKHIILENRFIGAEIAGIPELVNHTKNGFLFKSGNADSLESMVDASSLISSDEYTDFFKISKGLCKMNISVVNLII